MTEIIIGGRKVPLLYSTYELIAIQKALNCTGYQLMDEVFGIHQMDEDDPKSIVFDVANDPERMEKFGKLVTILGNAGLEQNGEEPDLTEKWVLRTIKPAMVLPYAVVVMAEIREGNRIENITSAEEEGPVDEVLEEQNAKKQPGN